MLQIASPIADVTTGSWAPTPLWERLDEATPDDSGSEVTSSASQDIDSFTVQLAKLAWPEDGDQTLFVRLRRVNSVEKIWVRIELFSGGARIAEKWVENPSLDYETVELTLTASQKALITSYLNFSVRITAMCEISVPCCPNKLPPVLNGVITNAVNCPRSNGLQFNLIWNPLFNWWTSGVVEDGGHGHWKWNFVCPNSGTSVDDLGLANETSCPDIVGHGVLQPGASCSPLNCTFHFSHGPIQQCCDGAPASFDIVIVEGPL